MAKKKTEPELVHFEKHYAVLAADLSLKRPSFCVLEVENNNGVAEIKNIKFKTVDNKTDKRKPHGELLNDILMAFQECDPYWMTGLNQSPFYVRETEIMHMKIPSERSLSKVVGLMDWGLWQQHKLEWHSIYPVTIKCLVAGSGKATKEEVAEALEYYIGKQDYKCDDESDAAAVAVAWLIQQGQIKQKGAK